jgi:DNA-binding CsgD family transcriptional regulator
MDQLQAQQQRYFELLSRQEFVASDLDYGVLQGHRPMLDQLAAVKNSAVTVFDMHKKGHVYASYNFESLFGYDMARIDAEDNSYFDSRIHPEDLPQLLALGIQMMEFFYEIDPAERSDYKLVTEYRILNKDNAFVRIVEQHQALELDRRGNVWLSIGVLDISPRQGPDIGVQGTVLNFRKGEIVELAAKTQAPPTDVARLTTREREILTLIQRGHLSKEISDMLCISVHTVNTHRQRILEKLDVGNSMEAVQMASKLGLLG